MEQLEGLLESPRAQTGNKISEDEMNKKYKLSYPKVTLGSVSLGVSNYLKQKFRMSTNEEIYDVNVVYRKSNRLYYHNYYSPSRGLIVASDNVANAMGIKMPHAWSNVTWHVWTKACQMETPPVHPSTLRAIIRDRVVNSDSSDILKEAFARSGHDLAAIAKSGKKTTTQLTWSRTDKSFYAIIGTPNGKGIVWLLREQSGILKKTVKSITAWATNFGTKDKPEWSWNVVFQLGRYEPDEDCGCSGMGCIIA
ncbi:hypothetical protein N7512_002812 [Penicillium capsulatum]|nr:hypothetical protein N7512_002812 [Penicillium capsulatum]